MSLFQLNTINTVDAVDEEDEDEDKGYLKYVSERLTRVGSLVVLAYLHSILDFCYERTLRDEREELLAPREWHWNDQRHEDNHLEHEKHKHLRIDVVISTNLGKQWVAGRPYKTIVESHCGDNGLFAGARSCRKLIVSTWTCIEVCLRNC